MPRRILVSRLVLAEEGIGWTFDSSIAFGIACSIKTSTWGPTRMGAKSVCDYTSGSLSPTNRGLTKSLEILHWSRSIAVQIRILKDVACHVVLLTRTILTYHNRIGEFF